MQIPRDHYSDSHTDLQLASVMHGYKLGEAALLGRAAYFKYDLSINDETLMEEEDDICDNICRARRKDQNSLWQEFKSLLQRAEILQRRKEASDSQHYTDFQKHVQNGFGDAGINQLLGNYILEANDLVKSKKLKDFYIGKHRLDTLVGKTVEVRGKSKLADDH